MSDSRPRLTAICPEPQNYSAAGLAAIGEIAILESGSMPYEELLERIPAFDLLFIRLQTRVTKELLDAGSRLRAVVSPTTGLNHIDLEAAAEHGVEVIHLKGQTEFLRSIPSTAEHTWALLLALVRHLPAAFASVRAGAWDQEPYRGHELHEKRLGIVGCGRLGAMVAHYGRAFGMKIATFDPYATFIPSYVERCETLQELLSRSDILSIHVPLNEETTGMIGRGEIGRLPAGSVIVNTSRGEVIEEDALVDALESGKVSGAAVDVVQHELEPNRGAGPLIAYAGTHENLIVTPHIGGATFEAVEKTDLNVVLRLAEWLGIARPENG